MVSLTSTSIGDVLQSTIADIDLRIVPTTHLSPTHPFCGFCCNHLTDLTTLGFCDPVIDAFVAVSRGDSKWHLKALNSTVIVDEQHQISWQTMPNLYISQILLQSYHNVIVYERICDGGKFFCKP
jgi:hypothetical protein